MKIALLTREINGVLGGMERQILLIASFLAKTGHHVTIYSLDQSHPQTFFNVEDNRIAFQNISSGNPNLAASLKGKILRQILVYKQLRSDNPDVAISFMFGAFLYSRFPTFLLRIPLILAERNSPQMYRVTQVRKYRILLFFAMRFANAITVQFPRYITLYPPYLRRKMTVIPNAIQPLTDYLKFRDHHPSFVFAGRFSFQKQLLPLIEAFSLHIKDYPDSRLNIYGKGEQLGEIELKINKSGLVDKVKVHGPVENISKALSSGNILCITSKWEGFPNVLAESLSVGIPGIGFKNCDGVSDLIQDGVNGWLEYDDGTVKPYETLLNRAAESIEVREDLSKFCVESIQQFHEIEIQRQWNSLVTQFLDN
jgi:glycosyltransferase involved in cell wall biosynthesis